MPSCTIPSLPSFSWPCLRLQVRNNNSSRFGKWLELLIDVAGQHAASSRANAAAPAASDATAGRIRSRRNSLASPPVVPPLQLGSLAGSTDRTTSAAASGVVHADSANGAAAGQPTAAAGGIAGCRITNYLLEKTRIVAPAAGERSYHIFYQLITAAPAAMRKGLRLNAYCGHGSSAGESDAAAAIEEEALGTARSPASDSSDEGAEDAAGCTPACASHFAYLAGSGCVHDAAINDREDWSDMRHAMRVLGIPQEEAQAIFTVAAAVLHLGNLVFKPGAPTAAATTPSTAAAPGTPLAARGGAAIHHDADGSHIDATPGSASFAALEAASALLGVPAATLSAELTSRTRTVSRDAMLLRSPISVVRASDSRHALAKSLYARTFDWIVRRVNACIAGAGAGAAAAGAGDGSGRLGVIGILDIFGA